MCASLRWHKWQSAGDADVLATKFNIGRFLPFTMNTLPLEVIDVIYSNCDLLTVVRSRLLCRQWNAAAQIYLARVRILYLGSNHNLGSIAPWLEQDELAQLLPTQFNAIEDSEMTNLQLDGLIRFAANYCFNIEAFICNRLLPFELFAHLLGPRMRFFTGRLAYNWSAKGYDILSKFTRLEQFPAHLGPCNAVQLKYKLPLKSIQAACHYGYCDCMNELVTASFRLKEKGPVADAGQSVIPLASIDPSYALDVRIATLDGYRIQDSGRFYFPNVKQVYIHGYLYSFLNIRLSLADSPKLELLHFEPKYPSENLQDIIQLLPHLKNLKVLPFPSYDNFTPPIEFWQVLTSSCPLIETLDVPFDGLGTEEAIFVAKLRNLDYFECEFMEDEFAPSYLANLARTALKELARGLGDSEVADPVSPEFIQLLKNNRRLTSNEINFFKYQDVPPVANLEGEECQSSEVGSLFDVVPILTDSDTE